MTELAFRMDLEGQSEPLKKLIKPALAAVAGMAVGTSFTTWPTIWLVCLAMFLPCLVPRFRQVGIVTVYQIGIPLLVGMLSLAVYGFIHEVPQIAGYAARLRDDWIQINAYFQIISTLYAICIAFTLWKAMNDYDDLKNVLRDEANKLKSILNFLDYFNNVDCEDTQKATRAIRQSLRDYVYRITRYADHDVDNANAERLMGCVDRVEKISAPEYNDRIALEGLIRGLSELIMIRSRRISAIENGIPPYLLVILTLMSLAIILFFFVFDSSELNAAHLVIPILSFLYTFFIVMLIDLDHPFDGYWRVRIKAFNEVVDMVR